MTFYSRKLQFLSVGALAKNGSFGFAKRWLLCRAKPNVPFVRLAFLVGFLSVYCCTVGRFRVATNGLRYGKCGNKLLLNCLPVQMYVKISNVPTFTQTRICYSVCVRPA